MKDLNEKFVFLYIFLIKIIDILGKINNFWSIIIYGYNFNKLKDKQLDSKIKTLIIVKSINKKTKKIYVKKYIKAIMWII